MFCPTMLVGLRILLAWLSLSLCVAFPFAQAVAQDGDPTLEPWRKRYHWTSGKELPQSPVQCLLQTQDAYAWVGTRTGLARFDGLHFTVFNRTTVPAMPSDDCRVLFEDEQQCLWIGTAGGLVMYKNHQFTTYPTELKQIHGNAIVALCRSIGGGVWIATSKHIVRFENGRFTFLAAEPLRGSQIQAVLEDYRGRLWVGTDMAPEIQDANAMLAHQKTGRIDFEVPARCIVEDRQGRIWWGNDSALHSLGSDGISHFGLAQGLKGRLVTWLSLGRNGQDLIIVTAPSKGIDGQRGLTWLEGGAFQLVNLADLGLENDVLCGIEDREGNLLVGTRYDGLIALHRPSFRSVTTKDGLFHDRINSVYQTDDGIIQVATSGGWFQMRNGRVLGPTLKGPPDYVSRYATQVIVQNRARIVWVAHRPFPGVIDAELMHGPPPDYVMGAGGPDAHLLDNSPRPSAGRGDQ